MEEQFSEVIRRTPDAQKRQICCWCAAKGEWELPVTADDLTVYCCSERCQQALQEALQ